MKKMSIIGIGHKLFGGTFLFFILSSILTIKYTWIFKITIYDTFLINAVAVIMIVSGGLFYGVSLKVFLEDFKKGALVKRGTFSMCRNPIYASWVLFFIPAIGLLLNSWIIASSSLCMYILLKKMIKEEEGYLEETFGEEYIIYKNSVNMIIPIRKWSDEN